MTGGKCEYCRRWRPLGELLAFWPPSEPSARFVCRPTLPIDEPGRCFRWAVGPAAIHKIEPASAATGVRTGVSAPPSWPSGPDLSVSRDVSGVVSSGLLDRRQASGGVRMEVER